jgi:hypothetical protein
LRSEIFLSVQDEFDYVLQIKPSFLTWHHHHYSMPCVCGHYRIQLIGSWQ